MMYPQYIKKELSNYQTYLLYNTMIDVRSRRTVDQCSNITGIDYRLKSTVS